VQLSIFDCWQSVLDITDFFINRTLSFGIL
jgi:hypothetical protein